MEDRLNDINRIVNSIKTQKSFIKDLENKAASYKSNNPDVLNNYELVKNKNKLKNCKNGGYIRYVNKDGKLRYGGMLLKVFKPPDSDITMLLLQNKNNNKWSITWERNIIFYKKQVKKGDNLRNLFISLLNED
jgi:hypothetical protein